MDESHFSEIDAAMLYVEEARARCERAAGALRADGAEAHLVDALKGSQEALSEVARRLRQRTYFAAPGARATR